MGQQFFFFFLRVILTQLYGFQLLETKEPCLLLSLADYTHIIALWFVGLLLLKRDPQTYF